MITRLAKRVINIWNKADKKTVLLISTILLIAGLAHAWNMFHYPSYFDDEGTYMSQAYSFATQAKLAPYTYWYDHAPVGWIVLAGWLKLTMGIIDFSNLIDSGRVFMLIIQVISTLFVFMIIRKITNTRWVAALGSLIYALSPVGLPLHRMIMLDNIMVTFLLASILLILDTNKLSRYIFSALLFGLAVLIKESAIFFLPAFFIYIFLKSHKNHRKMALFGWATSFGLVVFTYVLFALLKGELFPPGFFGGNASPHVSLIETLSWQSSRKGGFFLSSSSEFMFAMRNSWLPTDSLLIIFGTISTIIITIWGSIKRRWQDLFIGLLSILYVIYLIRGGIVNDQYLIPLIPFFAISISLLLFRVTRAISKSKSKIKYFAAPLAAAFIIPFVWTYVERTHAYRLDYTTHQKQAYQWYIDNVDMEAFASVDGYMISDFLVNRIENIYTDPGPQHYWKVDQDPALTERVLNNDWMNIQYAVTSSKVERETRTQAGLPMLTAFLANSDVIAEFKPGGTAPVKDQVTLAYSGPIKIYKRKSVNEILLNNSWLSYKNMFIKSYGQVVDPQTKQTTSEGQSYAMIRAERQNDKEMFDGVWQWTKDHMQHRTSDKLISWKWQQLPDGTYQLADSNTATDADIDIAYALLIAYERWSDEKYKNDALEIINDIWKKEIKEQNGRYITRSSAEEQGPPYRINPSYYSPYQFKLFSKYDIAHDWQKAANDSYAILIELQDLSTKGLLSNWAYIDNTGKASLSSVQDDTYYGYDAFRINWRIGLDLKYNNDERARSILEKINGFYTEQINQPSDIYAVYGLNGLRTVDYIDIAPTSGVLINAHALNDTEANNYANKNLQKQYNPETYSWGDPINYYNQNWAWFAYDFQRNIK